MDYLSVKVFCKVLTAFIIFSLISMSYAIDVPIADFDLTPYNQKTDTHIPPQQSDYTTALLKSDYQTSQYKAFYTHYFSSSRKGLSPWSQSLIIELLPTVIEFEESLLGTFSNHHKPPEGIHYGENFKAHDEAWLSHIENNMNLDTLRQQSYHPSYRAIAIANTFGRTLPHEAPDFHFFGLPGQGFPFDNLQDSAVWVGTPLYVFHVSKDKAWSLVLTPDLYFSWVKSSDIAYVSRNFIHQWQIASKQSLLAVTHTEATILDEQQQFLSKGYIGAVFPLVEKKSDYFLILFPRKGAHNEGLISYARVAQHAAQQMPVLASKETLAKLITELKNRPYGWGGAYFFNDCSQELKSLFTPLGIWLPRNSAKQAELGSIDLSASTMDTRLQWLKENGHPLMTLIYIGGHVMLYIGNEEDQQDINIMTYQNIWGLSPYDKSQRYVIGQSLFLPLLKQYPGYPDINSLANRATFKIVHLDELNINTPSPTQFARLFNKS